MWRVLKFVSLFQIILAVLGLLEYVFLVGFSADAFSVTLMGGRDIFLEWADLIANVGVSYAPKNNDELAIRVLAFYGILLICGLLLLIAAQRHLKHEKLSI